MFYDFITKYTGIFVENMREASSHIFSLPGRNPGRAIVLPPVLALAAALAQSLMLKFFM